MYLIAGLGNPGDKYDNTRHNVGFAVVDAIAEKAGIKVDTVKNKALYGTGYIGGQKCILIKPQTYMNLSGEAIWPFADFYKLDVTTEVIVISDDIALDNGRLRIRKKGSAGGHNGLKNIIAHLGTDAFTRVRVGVGIKPENYDQVDWVMGHFAGDDKKLMEEMYKKAAEAVEEIVTNGADSAMNKFNS